MEMARTREGLDGGGEGTGIREAEPKEHTADEHNARVPNSMNSAKRRCSAPFKLEYDVPLAAVHSPALQQTVIGNN